jgi:hypothetical protein
MRNFESPLEGELYEKIATYTSDSDDTSIEIQVPVKTRDKTYRLDLVVYCQGRMIGFECDGKEFHSGSSKVRYRDIFRDSYILLDTDIKTIFRISGKDIYNENKLPLCLFMANKYESFITNHNRKKHCLTECLPIFAYNQYSDQSETIEDYDYAEEAVNQIEHLGMLICYHAVNPDSCATIGYRTKDTLQKYCSFVEKNDGFKLSLDELVHKYSAEREL